MNKQRDERVDVIKGLTIFFMVLGHSYSNNNGEWIIRWISSFHMPLFFVISGVLYGMRKETTIRLDIKKKMRTLILPYLFWGTLYQMFLSILKIIGGAPISETICRSFVNVITVQGSSMWFLPTMFGAFIIFYSTR
ncbi:MAG: acyltransferase family protein [Schaedlerella sp.]|nr:acyltransferase family protein [Schaedlerella sp.]